MAGHPLPARSATWRQGDCFFQIGLLSGNGSKSKICSLGKGKSIEIWWFGVSIFRLEGRFLDLFLKIAAHMRVQCGTNNPVNPGSGGWRRFGSSNLTDEENPFDAPKPLASENGIVRLYIVTFVRKLGCYNYCCCIYIYIYTYHPWICWLISHQAQLTLTTMKYAANCDSDVPEKTIRVS